MRGLLTLVVFGVLAGIGSGGLPLLDSRSQRAVGSLLGDGVGAGLFAAGVFCACVIGWRQAYTRVGWSVALGGVVAGQALAVTALALTAPSLSGGATIAALATVALLGLTAVTVLVAAAPRPVVGPADDMLGIALGMGLMTSAYLMLQLPHTSQVPTTAHVVTGVVITTHAVAVAAVLLQRRLSARTAALLALTLPVVTVGMVGSWGDATGNPWDTTAHLLRAAVGTGWLVIAWVFTRDMVEQQRSDRERRSLELASQLSSSASREQRERMHELRSTIAGLVSGSALMDNPDIPPETRQRLLASVRRELDRMDRLLSGQSVPSTEIDLSQALGPILDLQRLKGRRVDLHVTSEVVRGRYDTLAEVLNILVDNAATHGGVDRSTVEVARRDDDIVEITVSDEGRGIPPEQRSQIFDWGGRRTDSPGEGIGLNLARRLVAEDGGALRLADRTGPGSSFVISLPAARRPLDDLALGGPRAWGH